MSLQPGLIKSRSTYIGHGMGESVMWILQSHPCDVLLYHYTIGMGPVSSCTCKTLTSITQVTCNQITIYCQFISAGYRISPSISLEKFYLRTKYYTDNSAGYTGNTLREDIIPIASWIFKVRAPWLVSGELLKCIQFQKYSIAPLVYHLYTNPFLCYSWDIKS